MWYDKFKKKKNNGYWYNKICVKNVHAQKFTWNNPY